MATATGNQVHHWVAYVDASVTSETTTTATVTCKVYWHALSWYYNYYGNGHGVIGTTTGSTVNTTLNSNSDPSVYQLITSTTKTYDKGTSSQSVTCKAVVSMTGDSTGTRNGTSTASVSVTIPALDISAPNAPSGCSATRNSDSKATVSWTNGSTTTTRPRTATLVERSVDGGSWAQIASASSTATSYADNGISANHRYRYRVRASNTAGKSSYSTSGYIYTTPAAPTSVTVSKTDASAVQVSIAGAAPYASAYDVAVTTDGGATWDVIAQPTSMPYIDANAPAGTVQYRVRAVRGSLASAWTTSNQLVTITPPLAPTITIPPPNPTELGATVTVGWTPNHPDGTAQSAAQVRVTPPSGPSTTHDVSGDATTYSVDCSTAGTWRVQVRTKGLDPDWGAWSDATSWGVYAAPAVVITSPASDGDTLDELPVVVTWTVTDPTGVSSQTVTLSDDNGVVYSATVGNSARSLSIGSDAANIANLTTYSVTVRITGGSGLATSAVREFGTDWAPPASPTATVQVDEDVMAANITVFSGEDSETAPETASLMVTRIGADGSRWVVGSGLTSGDTVTDPLPPLGVEYSYEVTASAATGATSTVTYTETIQTGYWAFNFGARAVDYMKLRFNAKTDVSTTHGGESYHFADGGMGIGLPVWYGTTDRDVSGSGSWDTVGHEEADRINALTLRYPVGWMRDPYGRRWRAHMRWSIDHGIPATRVWSVSMDWDAVRFEEAW